jgi:hypothetical protein
MKKIIKHIIYYCLFVCCGLCIVKLFPGKGYPPLRWDEIPNMLPIMAISGAIGYVILYLKNKK